MLQSGQDATEDNFNNAFVSRTADTSLAGKFSLLKAGLSAVMDLQKAVVQLWAAVGMVDENDANLNDYASEYYVDNGDSRKVAIGKLDAGLNGHATDIDNPHDTTAAQVGAPTEIEYDAHVLSSVHVKRWASDVVWGVGDTTKTVDVSGSITDANAGIWDLKDPNGYRVLCDIKAPVGTSVVIEGELPAGTYKLIGIQ